MLYSREITQKKKYDLVVAGGGFAGFSAAYAAARAAFSFAARCMRQWRFRET